MARSRVIGIDASRVSVDRLTGTETYTVQLLRAIAELDPVDPIELYLNSSSPPNIPLPGDAICIPFPRLWTHFRLSAEMARRRPGLLFVPAHVIPLVHPRSVVTIHDLGYRIHPESHPPNQARMLELTTRWSIRAASRIIAISETTRRDLIQQYHVSPDKIAVVHHGVARELRRATPDAIAAVKARYRLPDRYVLALGTVQPRKNYGRLAAAFSTIADRHPDLHLVIAGKDGWMADHVKREIAAQQVGNRITSLGYVDAADLPALYSGAEIYCQPSLYEGFGMPVLEAMACGVPVLAANAAALPEIGGDAAIYCDPLATASIARGIELLASDPAVRVRLGDRGRTRAAQFSWHSSAEQTLDILREERDRR